MENSRDINYERSRKTDEHVCKVCLKTECVDDPWKCPEVCPCHQAFINDTMGQFMSASRAVYWARNHRHDTTLHKSVDHYCKYCKQKGFHHTSHTCPERCACRNDCRKGQHYCQICREVGMYHSASACPKLCPCGGYPYHTKSEHVCKTCGAKRYHITCPLPRLQKIKRKERERQKRAANLAKRGLREETVLCKPFGEKPRMITVLRKIEPKPCTYCNAKFGHTDRCPMYANIFR